MPGAALSAVPSYRDITSCSFSFTAFSICFTYLSLVQILNILFSIFQIILRDFVCFLLSFQFIYCFTTDIADCNLCTFAIFGNLFAQLFTAFFSWSWEYRTDYGTIIGWVDTDIRSLDCFVDQFQRADLSHG